MSKYSRIQSTECANFGLSIPKLLDDWAPPGPTGEALPQTPYLDLGGIITGKGLERRGRNGKKDEVREEGKGLGLPPLTFI